MASQCFKGKTRIYCIIDRSVSIEKGERNTRTTTGLAPRSFPQNQSLSESPLGRNAVDSNAYDQNKTFTFATNIFGPLEIGTTPNKQFWSLDFSASNITASI